MDMSADKEESESSSFRDVRVTGVDAEASQHVKDDLWDIHVRVEGSASQAWRGLFDEEFENDVASSACRVSYVDRHIVIECIPAPKTEAYLERIEAIAARANRKYRTEVLPHLRELETNGSEIGSSPTSQRRYLRKLDPINGDG